MIRPRNLAISPIITVVGVSALLLAGGLFYRTEAPPTDAYPMTEPAPAPIEGLTIEEFPRFFEGSFIWDGESEVYRQKLGLDVHELNEVDGLIVATGRGTYTTNSADYDFTFRIEANPSTHEFTMWESEPDVAAGFVTNGKHVATFGDDLEHVRARWVGDDGSNGTLTLRAANQSSRTGSYDQLRATGKPPATAGHYAGGVRIDFRFEGDKTRCVTSELDRAKVHYEGFNADGVFDSSWKRDRPATFQPRRVIAGFKTALRQMCVGDYVRVWIPANQAYGDNPRAGAPTGDLVFDIELLDVNP